MPFREVKKRSTCDMCKGMRGRWLPPVYNANHPEHSLPTTWEDCVFCNGAGSIEETVTEWYTDTTEDDINRRRDTEK